MLHDPRNIAAGFEIPSEGYCDQPYVVTLADGTWLCVMTTGRGKEGEAGQHIVSTRSADRGRTWSPRVDIEPAAGPEASWAMPYVAPFGRVYVFYTFNAQNLRSIPGDDPPFADGLCRRVDSLGEYAFKCSDDGGRTWSARRWFIPVREMAIDRANATGGAVRFFWGVGKPLAVGIAMVLGFSKVGGFGAGFFTSTEACFLRSDNIGAERDPDRITWQTLPDGERGLTSPQGSIAEEPSVAALSDGSLFCTYRTVAGHPCHAYSRDGGRTWTPPQFMTRRPGGPLVNNPRAANFVRRLGAGRHAGKFVHWFHNHRGRGYEHRNPAWLAGGVERDGPDGMLIHWGLPQVALYADDMTTRISYPDFIEDGDTLYVTETQKSIARVHELPRWLVDQLFDTPE